MRRSRSSRPPLAWGLAAHAPVARGGHGGQQSGGVAARPRRTAPRAGSCAAILRAAPGELHVLRGGPTVHGSSGTWWARNEPSIGLPSTTFGPVQPLGERSTIIGQLDVARRLARPVRGVFLDVAGSPRMAQSIAARPASRACRQRIVALDEAGLPAAAQEERAPPPRGTCGRRQWGWLILYPFRCKNRQDRAVALMGFRNLLDCQAGGQRDRSRPRRRPPRHGRDQVGVVQHRAEGVGQGVAQLAALVDGTGRLGRHVADEMPPGKENCLNSFFIPSASWLTLG